MLMPNVKDITYEKGHELAVDERIKCLTLSEKNEW